MATATPNLGDPHVSTILKEIESILFLQKTNIQFPNMNTDRSLNKPYVSDVTL